MVDLGCGNEGGRVFEFKHKSTDSSFVMNSTASVRGLFRTLL